MIYIISERLKIFSNQGQIRIFSRNLSPRTTQSGISSYNSLSFIFIAIYKNKFQKIRIKIQIYKKNLKKNLPLGVAKVFCNIRRKAQNKIIKSSINKASKFKLSWQGLSGLGLTQIKQKVIILAATVFTLFYP